MNPLRVFTLSLLFLIPQSVPARSSLATTIVVLKTQSQIVGGADSMGLFVTGKQRTSDRFCKIQEVHDFFIASAGFFDTRAGQRLNIHEIVRGATKKSDALAVAVNRSSVGIVSALAQILSEAKKDDALYNLVVRGNVVTFFFRIEGWQAGCVHASCVHRDGRALEHTFDRDHSREVRAFLHFT